MNEHMETTPDTQYLKGFNEGYLLNKHFPELSRQLAKSLEQSAAAYAEGFTDGTLQYDKDRDTDRDKDVEREKEKDQEKEVTDQFPWMNPLPDDFDGHDPGKDIDMDRDDYDLEKE